MILRRISSALKRQDWATVLVEFALVIAGVLIALQVNNWNETRREKSETRGYLEQLIVEFEQIEEGAQSSVTLHQNALSGVRTIVRALDEERLDETDRVSFELGLRLGFFYNTSPDRSATLDEVISNGKISLIQDERLLRALLNYNAFLVQLDQGVGATRAVQSEYVAAFTAQFEYDLSRDFTGLSERFPVSAIGRYDLSTMIADENFRNAAEELHETQRYYLNWRRNMLLRIQDIRRLLDENIKTGGPI